MRGRRSKAHRAGGTHTRGRCGRRGQEQDQGKEQEKNRRSARGIRRQAGRRRYETAAGAANKPMRQARQQCLPVSWSRHGEAGQTR